LGSISVQNADAVAISGGTITGITPLTIGVGGTGGGDPASARFNLGLGSMSVQSNSSVVITGGTITGIAPLPVASGGTGGGTAADARTQLGAAAESVVITAGDGLTGGGNLTTSRTISIASNSNGFGIRTISTDSPIGGNDGDIWYQV
jgi:hypothetical protein